MNKEAFKNDIWNDYYEQAWDARYKIMRRIIQEGEKHPLRVISRLESISRFSKQERLILEEGPKFIFEEDEKYTHQIPTNVVTDLNTRSIQLTPVHKLPTGLEVDALYPHREKTTFVPEYTRNNNIEFLLDFTRLKNFDCIIELGSGYSQNLIKLFYQGGPDVDYYAGEYTESGTQCAKMLSDLDHHLNIIPFRFDYKTPDLSMIPKGKNVLVFTCHSIEQVTQIPNELIDEICSVGDSVTCVHIEPFAFQLKSADQDSELDANHRLLFAKNGWNQNLVQVLIYKHLASKIDVQYIAPNVMGGSKDNPSSLAVWKSL